MTLFQAKAFVIFGAAFLPAVAHGHAMMTMPSSRNYFAKQIGKDWNDGSLQVPFKEYTPWGLNVNTNVCGKEGGNTDYDLWLDMQGQPMPWISQASYGKGDEIRVDVVITAHHLGHFTLSACPDGRESTQECFDSNPLTFVEELTEGRDGMPKDEENPDRAMLWGDGIDVSYKFKLPDNLVGEEVLLQWIYWTANSCNYDGYEEYFNKYQTPNSIKGNWSPGLGDCGPTENIPIIREGLHVPEIFLNCAEVTVGGEASPSLQPIIAVPTPKPSLRPTKKPNPPTPTPAPITINNRNNDSRMIAYVGNWQPCPTDTQMDQYTEIVIAFAVSYTWSRDKNICSKTCQIEFPPMCNNEQRPDLIQKWKDQGKKIILSFGGAGMGGSWSGDNNDCWDYCFGREAQVVDRLTTIVNEMNLDGVDIDYEYFYEDKQNGSNFNKGKEAQTFLKEVTVGLRNKLPAGSEITHAPMEPDMEPGTAYFELLKEVSYALDFLMPQYYNGYQKPYENFQGTLDHFTTLTNDMFGGDASKVVFGFCINECASFNLNGDQAADVMENLAKTYPCNGGAFFWVADADRNANWSIPVTNQLQINNDVCSASVGDDDQPAPICEDDSKFKFRGKVKCKKINKMNKKKKTKICKKKNKKKDNETKKKMPVSYYCPKACELCN